MLDVSPSILMVDGVQITELPFRGYIRARQIPQMFHTEVFTGCTLKMNIFSVVFDINRIVDTRYYVLDGELTKHIACQM